MTQPAHVSRSADAAAETCVCGHRRCLHAGWRYDCFERGCACRVFVAPEPSARGDHVFDEAHPMDARTAAQVVAIQVSTSPDPVVTLRAVEESMGARRRKDILRELDDAALTARHAFYGGTRSWFGVPFADREAWRRVVLALRAAVGGPR